MSSTTPLDQFRARARSVRLPEGVRQAVLAEARGETTAAPTRRPPTRHAGRPVTRRAVLTVAGLAAGSAVAFLGLSLVGGPGAGGAAAAGSHAFTLTAYAEGTDQGQGLVLAANGFGRTYSWSEGDDGMFSVSSDFDLTCAGDGLTRVAYELDGSGVDLPDTPTDEGIFIDWYTSDRESAGTDGAVAGSTLSFEMDYEGGAPVEGTAWHNVTMHFAATGELAVALEELRGTNASTEKAVSYRCFDRVATCAVEEYTRRMAGVTLVVTATFDDGSTQTERYEIHPIEDVAEVYAAYREELTVLELQNAENPSDETRAAIQGLMESAPRLYTLTKLEG